MLRITINGIPSDFEQPCSILTAIHASGIQIPSLCHDDRVEPCGSCRLCLVAVDGISYPVAACTTQVADGMRVQTHTAAIEDHRRTMLMLLAENYPWRAPHSSNKEFLKVLRSYGITPGTPFEIATPIDDSHPYIHVDMSRCILCYRCVRICDEVQGQRVWSITGRGANTRILPDSGSTLAESSCVACGACVSTCPSEALQDAQSIAKGKADTWTRTVCSYCGTGCEMEVGTRADQLVSVRPALNAPVNKGHLCVKGRYAFDFVHAPDRITQPLIRSSGGDWRRVSWDEAIAFTAAELQRITKQYGADSIGVLGSARATNEENYVAQKFARLVVGTNNVDCCARVCHAPSAAGLKMMLGAGAATSSFDDIEAAHTIMVFGCNPLENHPIVGARIRQTARKGANLIVVDPRRTELCEDATVHLQLRPGTNVPLLNAMASVILQEGLADSEFVQERVAGVEQYAEFISRWAPERAAYICGVDPELIRCAARIYSTNRPSISFHGLGLTEHAQGTDGVMCLVNLALLTGNLGKPGSGVNPLRGQNNVQGAAHMGCEPGHLTGYVPIEIGRELVEQVWGAALPRSQGLNLMQMMDAASAGRLKALWVIGYDVYMTNPGVNTTGAALEALDFMVVQDIFLNETAKKFASVFLPAASSFEKDGTFMNSERRIQRVRQALAPLPDSKTDWEILCRVAGAMGRGDQFAYRSAQEIWEEIRAVWTVGRGISYSRLEEGGLQWPCPSEQHPGTTVLHAQDFPIGQRASLRAIDFVPTSEVTDEEFPLLLTTGRSLYQFNCGTMTLRTANLQLRPGDTLDLSPEDAGRLKLREHQLVTVTSRHGRATLPLRIDDRLRPGGAFATFHDPSVLLNQLTGPGRDPYTSTPEYKVIAVLVESAPASPD